MTTTSHPETHLPPPRTPAWLRLTFLLAVEVGMVVALHQFSRYAEFQIDWSNLDGWLDVTPPEEALAAATRYVALVLCWWLLASTIATALLYLTRAPAVVRTKVQRLTLPLVHRLIDSTLAVSITSSVALADMPAHAAPTVELEPEPTLAPARRAPVPDTTFYLAIYQSFDPLPEPQPGAPTHTVQGGDTLVDIAETHLGDPDRWPEIWETNRERMDTAGHTDPGRLKIGWVLELPHDPPEVEQPDTAAAVHDTASSYTVQAGDNFWSMAADQLRAAWGRDPTTAEVASHWVDVVDHNRHDLAPPGDPDLIYPGQTFVLPEAPPDPAASTGDSPTEPATADEPETSADAPATEPPTDNHESPDMPETPSQADEPAAPDPAPTQLPRTETDGTDITGAEPADGDEDNDDDAASSPWPSSRQIAVTGLLATLTLAALARRRLSYRRSNQPDTPTEPVNEDDVATERALSRSTAEVLTPATTAAQALAVALPKMADPPTVTGLVITPDGQVTVHLTEPVPPIAPFTQEANGAEWHLDAADEDVICGVSYAEAVLCTLATLGHTPDGDWVLVDLESLGALEIDGPRQQTTGMLRSIAAELAAQPQARFELTIIGIDKLDETGHGRHYNTLNEDLVRDLESSEAETAQLLQEVDIALTTTARANELHGPELLAQVVVAGGDNDPDLINRLTETSLPGSRGTALITTSPLGPDATRIVVTDHEAHIPHLGLAVQPATLDNADLERINRLLRNEPEGPPDEPEDTEPTLSEPEAPQPESPDTDENPQIALLRSALKDDLDLARSEHADHGGSAPHAGDQPGGASDDSESYRPAGMPRRDPAGAARDSSGDELGGPPEESEESIGEAEEPPREPTDGTDPPRAAPNASDGSEPAGEPQRDSVGDPRHGSCDSSHLEDEPLRTSTGDIAGTAGIQLGTESHRLGDSHGESEQEQTQARDIADAAGSQPETASDGSDDSQGADALQQEPASEAVEVTELPGGDGQSTPTDEPPAPKAREWRYSVRVFAGHVVEDPEGHTLSFRYGDNPAVYDKNAHRGPELISYLALSGREASRDRIIDDLWWGHSVKLKTAQNTIHATRHVLGGPDLLSKREGHPPRYRLADEVVTDVELLQDALNHAASIAGNPESWPAVLDVLRPHLVRIKGPAFHSDALGRGLADWADAHRITAQVEKPLIGAALLLAEHANGDRSRIPAALWAIDQALIACPTNETLTRAAMTLHAQAGDRFNADSRYRALLAQLGPHDLDPEPETEALRRYIMHDRPIG